jgi:hypothetical protein
MVYRINLPEADKSSVFGLIMATSAFVSKLSASRISVAVLGSQLGCNRNSISTFALS